MNVGQLIRKLEVFPPDFEVMFSGDDKSVAVGIDKVWIDLVDQLGNRIRDEQKDATGCEDVVIVEASR